MGGENMNINRQLAINNLKRNKQDTRSLIILATIIFTLLLTIALILPPYYQAQAQKRFVDNGKWIFYGEAVSLSDYQNIIDNNDEVVALSELGKASYNQNYLVTGVTGDLNALVNMTKLIDGKMPQDGEIVLSQVVLDSLNYTGSIGDMITIEYQDNKQNIQKIEARLSGIINNNILYQGTYLNFALSQVYNQITIGDIIIPIAIPSEILNCFVYNQQLDKLIQESNFAQIHNSPAINFDCDEIIYNNAYQATTSLAISQSIDFLGAIGLIVVIGIALMIGVVMSSLEKKTHDFALQRAVGQTKRQLYLMLFDQAMFICLIGLLLGGIMAVIISVGGYSIINRLIYPVSVRLDYQLIISMILVGIFIIIAGIYLPTFHASKKALVGTFDEEKFNRFAFHHYKLSRQSIFALAKREVFTNLKLNMILIIILTIMFSTINSFITTSLNYQDNQQALNENLENNQIRFKSFSGLGLSINQINQLKQYTNQINYYKRLQTMDENYSWDNWQQSLFSENLKQGLGVDYYSFDFDDKIKDSIKPYLTGRLPENENEITVYVPAVMLNSNNRLFSAKTDNTFEIGKLLTVSTNDHQSPDDNGNITNNKQTKKEYQIVGIIKQLPDENIIYFDNSVNFCLIINEDEFRRKTLQADPTINYQENAFNQVFVKTADKQILLATVRQFNLDHLEIDAFSNYYQNQAQNLKNDLLLAIIYAILSLGLALILFTYLAKYRISNQCQKIGILKSLGTTKKQIYWMYLIQVLMLETGALFLAMWSFVYYWNQGSYQFDSLFVILGFDVILLIVIAVIYCRPLREHLRQDIIKLIKIRD